MFVFVMWCEGRKVMEGMGIYIFPIFLRWLRGSNYGSSDVLIHHLTLVIGLIYF